MTIVNETITPDGCVEIPLPDKLRKNIIKEAVHRMRDNSPWSLDCLKAALVRGIVREVIMEKYPEVLDLLPKDMNKQADVIYLMGQNVECYNLQKV